MPQLPTLNKQLQAEYEDFVHSKMTLETNVDKLESLPKDLVKSLPRPIADQVSKVQIMCKHNTKPVGRFSEPACTDLPNL